MNGFIDRIVIPCSKTYEFIKLMEIVRFEGFQNYCRVYTKAGEMLMSTQTLGHYKECLKSLGFISCHRSHLVNELQIKRYHKEGFVEMKDDSTVPVSRRKREEFQNHLLQFYNKH